VTRPDPEATAATLTPEAKARLAATIRGLREKLIADLDAAAESAYRLSIAAIDKAGLAEAAHRRRDRLERTIDERARASIAAAKAGSMTLADARKRERRRATQEAAATFLNRLVLLRHLEALGLRRPAVVTGGFSSPAYREFRQFAPGLTGDATEGYAFLLQLVFDELAQDLPGLFGDVGLSRLFPIPPATLRATVEALDDPALAPAWTDDTTLGWVYQYWNDPEREALDLKIKNGGKVAPHEIAAKTQMFTERYMVEWLLHNSLGLLWLAMCRKNGWRADAEDVLPELERRRAEWREKREKGEVALDALMPIAPGLEERWKYHVLQPIPDDAVASAPASIRDVKILDPACGSGHFLVIAFDLLAALYREEARHRRVTWSDDEIAASIIEHNLHGVDIDPRAVQIAAAALYVKARRFAPGVSLTNVNLVAPALHLGRLPADDPALVTLRQELRETAGLPEALTNEVIGALATVDHWGTLLKVDEAIDKALAEHEREALPVRVQLELYRDVPVPPRQHVLPFERARASLLERLERFLAKHTAEEDLGLRLDGEQLAAGLRFIRIVKEGRYDLVVGNPPYQGASRMQDAKYIANTYPRAKADLYAAFLERGLELVRSGGVSAFVTMQGWMFLGQYAELRRWTCQENSVRCLADLRWCAFECMRHATISMAVTMRGAAPRVNAVAIAPTNREEREESIPALHRKRASLLSQLGQCAFSTKDFTAIDGAPLVYWWPRALLSDYARADKLGAIVPVRQGAATSNNARFLRSPWEVSRTPHGGWEPFIKGGKGRTWIEPLSDLVAWRHNGLELKTYAEHLYGSFTRTIKNGAFYFHVGVAFSPIGSRFSARAHRHSSVFGHKGPSVFPDDLPGTLCAMNRTSVCQVLESLNPGMGFEVGDVNRLPIFPVENASEIYAALDRAFTEHEAARETSVEFRRPGASPWRYAQEWAQRAVDRPAGEPLPPYEPIYDPPKPEDFVSFAVGVALGRFGANGEGILAEAHASALPAGILYLSSVTEEDSLAHPACAPLHAAWTQHGRAVSAREDLRAYLRRSLFASDHRTRYENRPIYLPLSSAKKSFVAWVSIHRFAGNTLRTLLSDWLVPDRRRLEGEIEDLKKARQAADRKAVAAAERRYDEATKLLKELTEFIAQVTQIAERGAPQPDPKTPAREVDVRFVLDLDDGVMIHAAGLWPLLEPQWGKTPRGWWTELASGSGRKDYDWSHLAARYFPERVAKKCADDPSLAVAHGCFWRLHAAKAYAWELRLQDEIRPGFTIDEPGSDEARARFLAEQPEAAERIEETERKRRERKARKAREAAERAGDTPLFDAAGGGDEDQEDEDAGTAAPAASADGAEDASEEAEEAHAL